VTQQHRDGRSRPLGEPHTHQRLVDLRAPALDACGDPTLSIDQDQIGDAREDAVGAHNAAIVVEENRKEVELFVAEHLAHRGRLPRELDSHERRAPILRKCRELGLQEPQRVVTVGAGVEEEEDRDRFAAQRRELELLVAAIHDLRREIGGFG
jgi:hypothetical protein